MGLESPPAAAGGDRFDGPRHNHLYRIANFFALAVVLLILAFLYQRGRGAAESP